MQFDPKKNQALLAVIETGSFELAAKKLHLTASAISQRIQAMEEECGFPLVVRARPCRATLAGKKILLYLQRSRWLENEFRAELSSSSDGWLSIPIAVNNDSLGTWLLPGLTDFLQAQRILLDITVDDQAHTHTLLEEGLALAGISSQSETIRGCVAEPLGIMRYRLLATPVFKQRWFPEGLTASAARQAPLLVFDRKDLLQWTLLEHELGVQREALPCHYVPGSEPFLQAVTLGIGYGLLPELQARSALELGQFVELAPHAPTDVMLYWHRWRVQSPKLESLSAAIRAAAREWLRPAHPA